MATRVDNTIAQLSDETVIALGERIFDAMPEAARLAPISRDKFGMLRNASMEPEERAAAMAAVIAWVEQNRAVISRSYPDAAPPFDHLQSYWENFFQGPRESAAPPPLPASKQRPTRLLDLELGVPFGIPACAITPHSGYIDYFARRGFDLITYKTVRPGPWNAHPSPNLAFASQVRQPLESALLDVPIVPSLYPDALHATTDASFVNSIGVPSLSVDQWMADVARTRQMLGAHQVLIVSVMGSPEELHADDEQGLIDQFERVAGSAKEAGADVVELNLSCPNTGGELLCRDPRLSGRIVNAVRRTVGDLPIFIKISYLPDTDLELLIEACRSSMNGVVAINAVQVHARSDDGRAFFAGRSNDYAGLSGVGIRNLGLSVTRKLSALRGDDGPSPEDWVIVGIGGVMSTDDYQGYRDAGADAVQSCTGAWLDPYLARDVRAHVHGLTKDRPGDAARQDHSWRRLFFAVNDAVRTGGLSLRVEEPPSDDSGRSPRH